jgi:hypothetical protein
MKRLVIAGLALAALAAGSRAGGSGIGVGESAPLPEAKEVVGLPGYGARLLEGKVVYLDIFRTW